MEFTSDDTIIVLGDIVDRGPDTKGVINFLRELQQEHALVLLRGNHELMMLRARNDRAQFYEWKRVGGDAVLDSYQARSWEDIPQEDWDFIESSLPYFETDTHFFVHANAYPDRPLESQPEFMLYWEFFDSPAPHESGKVMVCGHTSQKSGTRSYRSRDLHRYVCPWWRMVDLFRCRVRRVLAMQ